MLVETTFEFIKTFNSKSATVESNNQEDIKNIIRLKSFIEAKLKLFEAAEENLKMQIELIKKSKEKKIDLVYVRSGNSTRAVLSDSIVKPDIKEVPRNNIVCNCFFDSIDDFQDYNGYSIIETEEKLKELDLGLSSVCLSVYDHSYRSFDGFSCYLAIYDINGHIYIIDAIFLREFIPSLRLLTCAVKKIIHCQDCLNRLCSDFGTIGCFLCYSVPEQDVYFDWRIRPLPEIFLSHICTDLKDCVKWLKDKRFPIHLNPKKVDPVLDFVLKFKITSDLSSLPDLIKLRKYLAKKFDESENFVLTDKQLYNIFRNTPTTIAEFDELFERMSYVLRLHVMDFLIVLRSYHKKFSLSALKLKYEDNFL